MLRRLLVALTILTLAGCGTTQFSPASEVPPVVAQQQAPEEPQVGVPVMITIPKLGVVDDIVPVGLTTGNAMEVPKVDQTGWYRLAPKPGERGPAVLAAHVNYAGVQGSFARLAELRPGDKLIVTDDGGVVRTFVVFDVRTIAKADYQTRTVPLVFGARATADLVAVTCGGRLSGHEYESNVVASSHLLV